MRVLRVWWDEQLVGALTQDRHGEIAFAYARGWLERADAPALSASLPKREQSFARRECRPFFAGLLPEESQRIAAAQALGVSRANDFALLERLGGEVAGALQILPEAETPAAPGAPATAVALDDAALVRVLDTLPARPLLAGEQGLRLSLAGAQAKLPVVVLDDGAIALPEAGQPTTHIVKPPIPRFAATTENEAFVMRLAAAVRLDVARVEVRAAGGRTFLLVQRYDRSRGALGRIERLHQEDFCQALAVAPENKYQSEGGPGFRECFALLRRVAERPAGEVLKLLDALIFNLVAGNADAHGKNFSILYDPAGARLAPLYDLLSTEAYPELSAKQAMKIGKRSTLSEVDSEAWAALAADTGLGLPLVRRRVVELCDAVREAAASVASDLSQPALDATALARFAQSVRDRAARCRTTVARS